MNIVERLKNVVPDLVGHLEVNYIANTVLLSGHLYTNQKDVLGRELKSIISELYPDSFVSGNVEINTLTVSHNTLETNKKHKNVLDEVSILYYGMLDVRAIKEENKFRSISITVPQNLQKIDNCVKVLNFISPIVLDSDLKIIDGNKRLQLAKDNEIKTVPVIVIDDNGMKADFLRLALNRSAEFQKWNYSNVDDYVDNTPQAQPILEPLGFFGRKILPVSFFTNTIVDYIIDPFNEKQKQYKQEIGLAEWAKYRREQMELESAMKRAKKKKVITENTVSLFDLFPKEEDFLETNDFYKTFDEYAEKYTKAADEITNYCDDIKRKEIEEKGGVWQIKQRQTKEVALENRQNAIKRIKEHSELTEVSKTIILENLDEFADVIENDELLKERLSLYEGE